nr:2Fe-2S iron-sulfur cluster-binding protein [Rahnella perminowiae]
MNQQTCMILYNGEPLTGRINQPLIDFLQEQGKKLPHVCYHPALPPLETCNVCWVEADGEKVRGCTLTTYDGLAVNSQSDAMRAAQEEGMVKKCAVARSLPMMVLQ